MCVCATDHTDGPDGPLKAGVSKPAWDIEIPLHILGFPRVEGGGMLKGAPGGRHLAV